MGFWGIESPRSDAARCSADWDVVATPRSILQWLKLCRQPVAELRLYDQRAEGSIVLQKMTGRIGKHALDLELVTRHTLARSSGQILRAVHQLEHHHGMQLPLPGGARPAVVATVADPSVLEAIKTSHILWMHKWLLHMQDMHALRQCLDYAAPPSRPSACQALLQRRRQDHIDLMGGDPAAHINLNQTNHDFLDKYPLTVKRFLKHDDLHLLVMYGAAPLYTRMKTDQALAKCDAKLFDQLSPADKLHAVREEAMVIALERYVLPGRESSEAEAYFLALQRICTSLTKGWLREFAIDHWPLLNPCDKDLAAIQTRIHALCDERRSRMDEAKALGTSRDEPGTPNSKASVTGADDMILSEPTASSIQTSGPPETSKPETLATAAKTESKIHRERNDTSSTQEDDDSEEQGDDSEVDQGDDSHWSSYVRDGPTPPHSYAHTHQVALPLGSVYDRDIQQYLVFWYERRSDAQEPNEWCS